MTNLTSMKQALAERNLEILVSDLTPYKDRPIGSLRIDMSDVRSILNLHRESNQLVASHEQLEAENAALKAERDRSEAERGEWLPISLADRTITDVQDFSEVGITLRMSDRYWVRDEDGRVYEAAWSEGNNGRDFWWDFEGESPVDPVEFMPHPLDPRFTALSTGQEEGR